MPPSGEEIPAHRLPEVGRTLEYVSDGTGLKATMNHTIGTARVSVHTVVPPVSLLHQLPEAVTVLISDQIARPLPPLGIAGGVAPGSALIIMAASQESQV